LPQVGTSAAINAFGFDATKFGHMSVFWLPYEINPYGAHGWELWEAKRRCGKNEKQLGKMDTIEECAQAVSRTHRCGPVFVWSPRNSPGSNTWQCTCCKDDYTEGGQTHPDWNLYLASSNWLCYDGRDNNFKPEVPPFHSQLKLMQHDRGACGGEDQIAKEIARYSNDYGDYVSGAYGFEVTLSNGDGNVNYNQTYAAGPPGRYIHYSPGSDAIWHGHSTYMYYITTDVTFEEFFKTARSLAVKMNDESGYDAVRKNCQDFSLRFLDALGSQDLKKKAADHAFVTNPVTVEKASVLCDAAFPTGLCWPIQGHGSSRRRRRHVGMPDECHQTYDVPALKPNFFGTVYTCAKN